MTVEVLPEEESMLLRVALAEALFGFERRLNESSSEYEWRGNSPLTNEPIDWVEADGLPAFPDDDALASNLLIAFADRQRLIVRMSYDATGEGPAHIVEIARRGDGAVIGIARTAGPSFAHAACAAVTMALKVPIAHYHQLLFPRRYIVGGANA